MSATYYGWFVVISMSEDDDPPLTFDGPYATREEAQAMADQETFDGKPMAQVIYASITLAEPVKIHRKE